MTTFELSNLELYYQDIWNQTKQSIKDSEKIDDVVFESFFEDTQLSEMTENTAIITSKMKFNLLMMEQNQELIQEKLFDVTNRHLECKFLTESEYEDRLKTREGHTYDTFDDNILADFTFDNFVVGKSNKEAQSAALFCAHSPGKFYNPLFIYGDSGLGKTHLMYAIGNYIKKNTPDKKILYIAASDFIDQFFQASKTKTLDEFKAKMNGLDVLLVDDIQILAGKDKTNEMFFQIYNSLVNNRKQIILTSDKPPKDLNDIEERLISRFAQGLTVTINSPEFETRLNILKMKLKNNHNIDDANFCDEESLAYIATNCSDDIRSLEGMLNRLMYYSINFGNGRQIDYAFTVEALQDVVKRSSMNPNGVTPALIMTTVSRYYGLTKQQLLSKSRTKNISTARHIAMYLCRKLLDMPYKKIGNEFGKLDHATVISACNKIEKLSVTNEQYKQVLEEIQQRLL